MSGELAGKTALITGAGGAGCGGAIARRFAAEGASIVVLESHERRCRDMAAELAETYKVRTCACPVDIASRKDVDLALSKCANEIGHVDIVVNNAAINVQKSIIDMSPDEFDRVVAVDFSACWYLIHKTLGGMLERENGNIVNISSIAAYIGGGGVEAPYSASKAALHDLTRAVALEGGPRGVRCNAIAVGMVQSKFIERDYETYRPAIERTPLRRVARPEEIAEIALFLASDRSSFITGEVINASGGYVLGQ